MHALHLFLLLDDGGELCVGDSWVQLTLHCKFKLTHVHTVYSQIEAGASI